MTTDSAMSTYDVTPEATRKVVYQLTERIVLLEVQVAQLQMCARSQRYSDEDDCQDIGGVGLTE